MDFKDELRKLRKETNKLVSKEQFQYIITQNIESCTDKYIESLKQEAKCMIIHGEYEILSRYTILENYKMVVRSPIVIEWRKENFSFYNPFYNPNNVVSYGHDVEGFDCIIITIADNGEIYRNFLSTLSKKAHKDGFAMMIEREMDDEFSCRVDLHFSISWSEK